MVFIGIDPGHGGNNTGATGPEGTREKDINLSVGQKLAEASRRNNIEFVLTRTTDKTVSLYERSNLFNEKMVELAVSIHCNGSSYSSEDYVSTFIIARGGNAEIAAVKVQRQLVSATDWEDGGVRVKNLHILRETNMPAILVEMGFITNPEQEKWLSEPDNQTTLAEEICRGISDYFGISYEPAAEENNERDILEIWVGRKTYKINGKEKQFDVTPQIESGRIIGEIVTGRREFGDIVEWDESAKKMTVRRPKI